MHNVRFKAFLIAGLLSVAALAAGAAGAASSQEARAAFEPVLVPVPDPQSPDACRARRLSAGFPALSSLPVLPALMS